MSDDDIVLELHHIVIAGFIVFAEFGGIVRQLDAHPEVRARLVEEIKTKSPGGAITLESLMSMPYLLQVVNEVKRLSPIVPAVFGRTKKDFEIDGVGVPAAWMMMWALTPSHIAHGVYDHPQQFDPDRFSAERAEDKRHEHAFAPQGAGPATGHRCPGSITRRISWRYSRSCCCAATTGRCRRRITSSISARRRRWRKTDYAR